MIPLPPTIDWGLQRLKMIRFITHTSGGGKLSWIRICMCVRVYVCVCLSVCVCAFMSETQQVSIYLSFSLCDYFHLSLLTKAQTWCVCLGGSALCLCVWSVWLIGLKRFFFFSFFFFLSWNAVCTEVSLNTHNTKKKSGSFSLLSPTSLLLVSVNICSVWLYFLTLMVNSPALCENYRWLRKKGSQKQPNAELQTFNQGKRRILFPHIFSAIIQQAHNRAHKQQTTNKISLEAGTDTLKAFCDLNWDSAEQWQCPLLVKDKSFEWQPCQVHTCKLCFTKDKKRSNWQFGTNKTAALCQLVNQLTAFSLTEAHVTVRINAAVKGCCQRTWWECIL